LYLHGGGWVVGGLDSHDFICFELAMALGAMVVAVDYRLAPEHPFPAGFEDCLSVWRALRSGPFWFDPQKLLVAGDSAGGNLAAALCLALRDAGEAMPAAQVLIYPGLGGDDRLPSAANAPMHRCSAAMMCTAITRYTCAAALGRMLMPCRCSPTISVDCRQPGSPWRNSIRCATTACATPNDWPAPAQTLRFITAKGWCTVVCVREVRSPRSTGSTKTC
jgi:hypothetical protein